MIVLKQIKRVLGRIKRSIPKKNEFIKSSQWYYDQFPHLREYQRLKQGAEFFCIGSTPAKNAIDFSITSVEGYNLAVCPETIFYDFQVLKNYHSYLNKGGHILFVLCPFTFLKDYYRNEYGSQSYLNIRYYPILHRAMIDTYDPKIYHEWVEDPIISVKKDLKKFIRQWIKTILKIEVKEQTCNPDTPEASQEFCKARVKSWMREFHMPDLNPSHIPAETENAIRGNIRIFQDMKEFIEEREYKATIVIPPFPKEMTDLLPEDLVQHTLYEPIKQTGIPYISFYGEEEWLTRDYYYHGFLLNKTGRNLFTKKVLERINSK